MPLHINELGIRMKVGDEIESNDAGCPPEQGSDADKAADRARIVTECTKRVLAILDTKRAR